ncbi:MAG: alpha-hydroxy-acid oxidizing protein [Gammaproteobacteria bacterium]|nr:alpha-hydroxy-acid oxidizing protein [Gammaproteobacteria bacterium]
MKAVSVIDYRLRAKRRIPHFLFEYLDGGSYSEVTKKRNQVDLKSIALRQRVLRDVSNIDTSVEIFGESYALPVALAPVGLAGMYARRGEVQAVRAADAMGIPFTLSTVGVCPIGEVSAAATKPFWFQLYMIRDRSFMRDMLELAREANCSVLVFTVDMPVPGCRYRDYRSGLAGEGHLRGNLRRIYQAMLKPRWAWDVGIMGRPHQLGNVSPVLKGGSGLEDFMKWMGENFDPSVSWLDLEFIRDHWDGPILLKGILDPEDARKAADLQIDGLIVSNHGGRQLDGVTSSVNALRRISAEVGDRVVVCADGGVYSGLDVVRMLALGAKTVFLGRSWVYGLAANGQKGVEHVLELIRKEVLTAMALTGCQSISDIRKSVVELERTSAD